MKKTTLILFTLFFTTESIIGQSSAPPPPPPPPAIFSAPNKEDIKEYVAEDSNFLIDFAGEVFVDDLGGTSSNKVKGYYTKKNGAYQMVLVRKLADSMLKSGSRSFYDEVKRTHLLKSGSKLVYEKDILHRGVKGFEFGFTENLRYVRARIFIFGNKSYELYSDVTNWHILTKNLPDKVRAYNEETDRFFNSFRYKLVVLGDRDVPTSKPASTKKIDKPTVKISKEKGSFNRKTKIYNSVKGGFQIYFPRKPILKSIKISEIEGVSYFNTFTVQTRAAVYTLGYLDSPTEIKIQAEKDLNYERQIGVLLQRTKAKKISEEKFQFRDLNGKDYVLTTRGNTIRIRMFMVKQRLFRLMTITRGVRGRISAKALRFQKSLTNKFFRSFKVTSIPKPFYEEVKLPYKFGVKIDDKLLRINYFGAELKLPKEWEFMNELEKNFLSELGSKYVLENSSGNKDLITNSVNNTKVLVIASKATDNKDIAESSLLSISAESLTFPVFDPKTAVEITISTMLEDYEKVTVNTKTETIGNKVFAWYETFDTEDKNFTRVYVANINKLAFQIVFIYENKSELKDLELILDSLKFNEIKNEDN